MSDWIALYDAPADSEPPFECLVGGKVYAGCVWVKSLNMYAELRGSVVTPMVLKPTHWRPANHSEHTLEKVAPYCHTCANRGRVNGLSQESFCESCVYESRGWRKDHYLPNSISTMTLNVADSAKRRCEACAILPCSCK